MKTLITGASGILGSKIVEFLSELKEVKAGFRDESKFINKENVESIYFDYNDSKSFDKALSDVDSVLLMAPPLDFGAYEKLSPVVEILREKNIKKVVLISALGMDANDEAPLRKVELDLIKYDFDYVIVRPNFFMENFSVGGFSSYKATNQLALCAGEGKTSFISAIDIAKVVTKVMVDDKYNKKEFNITGIEALSIDDVIKIINNVKGTNYKYKDISKEEFKQNLLTLGMNESDIDFLIMLLSFVKDGYISTVTNQVEEITGSKPISFEEFTKKYI